MITAAQLRAARGMLDWTRADLAKAAGISTETIKNIEHGVFKPQDMTEKEIIKAFAIYDVEFIENEGVRKNDNRVISYEGNEGFRFFMDDVYETLKTLGGEDHDKPTCISYVDDRFFIKHLGDYLTHHIQRMNKLGNIKTKILIEDKPHSFLDEERAASSYREYRKPKNSLKGNVPFYVYGNKLAILIFDESKKPQIVVITSPLAAKAYRDQFQVMWSAAKPLNEK